MPNFGNASYLYQRMPMQLSISPSIWQSYINAILDCLQSNDGQSVTVHPHKEITHGIIRRFVKGFKG